jgi:hypothetical protein
MIMYFLIRVQKRWRRRKCKKREMMTKRKQKRLDNREKPEK